eukprot:CAMPEP_0183308126 /NCGR_PEP_ID=MMETSP0160_2-20130417/19974_1 /TAXON_ID=2839 ORGANISM="Odontella Sinensis, Strain Grunow 1884" /NCGR_SAMPLE_ID=MMETSP0160_2 /ASSEMBLY_ACC=CAM_ASM_000250 /LENGTH=259 /DNA_ID=CAMNT_0025471885 /DNA_START=97 /DNA_END=876 /DNA_ORIENTATION=+
MCRIGLTSLAVLATIASGFSSSPNTVFTPRAFMSSTSTATVRRRPSAATSAVATIRGGAKPSSPTEVSAARPVDDVPAGTKCPVSFLASAWGAGGVAYILLKAVRRLLPIAIEPFVGEGGPVPLTSVQLGAYVATALFFAYAEGYKGFQKKFSPLVVSRSRTLIVGTSSYLHILLAPFYSMGLFHATKKRMTVSWCVTLGVAAIVAAVKRLPYPWRNVVDGGVVVGLTWGTASIIWGFLRALATGESPADAALPGSDKK